MQSTLTTSEQINEIAKALSSAMGEVRDALKDQQGYGYKYADLSQVLEILRPLMKANGLALSQFPSFTPYESPIKIGNEALIGNVRIEGMLTHSSGQWMRGHLDLPAETKKGLSLAQIVGSTITYARRYQAAAIFGVAQSDDDAADQASAQSGNTQRFQQGKGRQPAQQSGVVPASAEQLTVLREALAQVRKKESDLCSALGIRSLEQLPAGRFNEAKAKVEAVARQLAARTQSAPQAANG